jgi:anion-transporting  ArsA/GET3 family ATPase
LLFVTGKGGVGKTTIAAGLAVHAASRGKRVLVGEVDATGTLATAFECGPLAFQPRQVDDRLWAMAMNTEDSLREYLRVYTRVPLVARIGPLARTLDFVASAAPGVREILVVGKFCYEVRERHYDLVIVDAPATGHVVGHLAAPWAINELVQVGLVRDQTKWMIDILGDPARTGVVVVTTPEEMPVNETVELVGRLGAEVPVSASAVVVNRVLPELFTRDDEAVFDRLRQPAATRRLRELAGEGAERVLDAAALAVALRRSRADDLSRLDERLPPGLPLLLVPELFARADGRRVTIKVAAALGEEIS